MFKKILLAATIASLTFSSVLAQTSAPNVPTPSADCVFSSGGFSVVTTTPRCVLDPASSHRRHDDGLTSDNYYTNVDGRTIHGPAYTRDGHRPSGATAKCRDGTWSFSRHHRGTCSYHGGVARWL